MRHIGKRAEFHLNSFELSNEENREKLRLDERHCLEAVLILEGIQSISIHSSPFEGQLAFSYDDAEVLDFDIRGNAVELGIQWRDFPPKPRTSDW